MKKLLLMVLAVAAVGMVGCGASTISEMKSNPYMHKTTVVKKPLVETFEAVRHVHDEEFANVQCSFYPHRGECMIPGSAGKGYLYYVEILPVDDLTTKVEFYAYSQAWTGSGSAIDKIIQRLHEKTM